MNLLDLQNKIKRDSISYQSDFLIQKRHFDHLIDLLKGSEGSSGSIGSIASIASIGIGGDSIIDKQDLGNLILFLSQVSHCYKEECKDIPIKLIELLDTTNTFITMIKGGNHLLKSIVQGLIMFRNKNFITTQLLLPLLFNLFKLKDKVLRLSLFVHIIGDIKNQNKKSKNIKLNKSLQNYLQKIIISEGSQGDLSQCQSDQVTVKYSLNVLIDLYKRNIWNDVKTINIISDACFSIHPKIIATALHFFLGYDNDQDSDSDSDDDLPNLNSLKHSALVNKKTKSRKIHYQKVKNQLQKKKNLQVKIIIINFPL